MAADIVTYAISTLAIIISIWSIILTRRTNQMRELEKLKRKKPPISREVTIDNITYVITAVTPDSKDIPPVVDSFRHL